MALHRVKMVTTTLASEDGIHAKHYMAGRIYSVTETLLMQFVEMGVIELVDDDTEHDPITSPETKVEFPETRTRKDEEI